MSLTQSRSMGAGSTRGSGTVALSVRGTASGLTGTFTFSSISGLTAGETLVAFLLSNDNTNNTNDAPSFSVGGANWTLVTNVEQYSGAVNARLSMYTRTATASSTDNFTFSDADGTPNYAVIAISGTTGTRAAPTVTSPVNATTTSLPSVGNTGDLLIRAIISSGAASSLPASMTNVTVGQNGYGQLRVAYWLNETPGTSSTTQAATSGLGAISVAYKP
jgi:hypothetical protein